MKRERSKDSCALVEDGCVLTEVVCCDLIKDFRRTGTQFRIEMTPKWAQTLCQYSPRTNIWSLSVLYNGAMSVSLSTWINEQFDEQTGRLGIDKNVFNNERSYT